jgi:nucleoid-associated protein YgaU
MSRYVKRKILVNDTEKYKDDEIFENRGVKKIRQHITPIFKRFSKNEYNSVRYVRHYWNNGDRFWKLANQYYGDPTLWWVIARWNFAPTESHVSEGQEIRIPTDLQRALSLAR